MGELNDKTFIDIRKAREFLGKGFLGADLHVHSSASYDVIPSMDATPESIVRRERALGLVPMITDHDTLDGAYVLGIAGVEIKIKPPEVGHTIHVNVYGKNTEKFSAQFHDLENIASTGDFKGFISYLKDAELSFQYNHPFWCEPFERLNIAAVLKIAKEFPVIELNSGRIRQLNDHAYRMAKELGKGITSTTDSHIGEPGNAMTVAKGSDFFEFWDNVANGNSYLVRNDMTLSTIAHDIEARILQYTDCDIDEFRKKDLKTGILMADAMIDHLASDVYKKNILLKKAVSFIAGHIIGPSVAAALLIIPQNRTAYDIDRINKTWNYKSRQLIYDQPRFVSYGLNRA